MKTLKYISEVLNRAVRWLLIACFSVMIVAYFGQIVLRYGFNTGLVWTEEVTRYTNIMLVMFGTAVLAGKKEHINISALEEFIPYKYKKWAFLVQQILTLAFFGAVIFIGFNMVELAGTQVSTNMRIPMKYVYSIFPLAFSVLAFQTTVYVLNELLPITKKEEA